MLLSSALRKVQLLLFKQNIRMHDSEANGHVFQDKIVSIKAWADVYNVQSYVVLDIK